MVLSALTAAGGVASTRQLASEYGVTEQQLRAAVRRGDVLRPRRGWVALPTADAEAVAAVRIGGALTCTSVLRRHHVWSAHDRHIHVRLAPERGDPASPFDRRRPLTASHPVTLHRPGWTARPSAAVDSFATALAVAVTCQPRLDAIASLDSALNRGLLTRSELFDALAPLAAGHRELMRHVDGSAQSGLESKARMSLWGRRVRVRSQVEISGVGHVDLVIGDRLVLELDGYEWHSTKKDFEEDRRRDLALNLLGFLVVRLSYAQVTWHWAECEAALLELVRRREHLWPRTAARSR